MTGLDLSRLSGPDAEVALRSYPRRYRAAVLPVPGDDVAAELAARIGPDGHAALDLVNDTANTFVLLGRALHDIAVQDTPVLHPGVIDPGAREWPADAQRADPAEALNRLADEATALAEAVSRTPAAGWMRGATVAGGPAVTALDVVREAVRTGADNLRSAENAMAAARRSHDL